MLKTSDFNKAAPLVFLNTSTSRFKSTIHGKALGHYPENMLAVYMGIFFTLIIFQAPHKDPGFRIGVVRDNFSNGIEDG